MYLRTRGITLEERDSLLASQGGVCACCKTNNPGSKKGWHTDHCHTSNKIRSVLCAQCNISLGHLKENREKILQLLDYVINYCTEGVTTIETTPV